MANCQRDGEWGKKWTIGLTGGDVVWSRSGQSGQARQAESEVSRRWAVWSRTGSQAPKSASSRCASTRNSCNKEGKEQEEEGRKSRQTDGVPGFSRSRPPSILLRCYSLSALVLGPIRVADCSQDNRPKRGASGCELQAEMHCAGLRCGSSLTYSAMDALVRVRVHPALI